MISVCMATYNGEKYVREQTDSILAQLGADDELIVSDDGSADATLAIVRSFNDPRIKIFQNPGCHGPNGNFENALNHAQGDYIFLADQDDIWLPGKVDTCIEALRSADCIVHDCIVTDSNLNPKYESFFAAHGSRPGFWKNWLRNSYVGCCMAFRKKVLGYALPFPAGLPVFHDGWIASLADIKGTLRFIPFKGICFRRHEANASTTAGKSKFSRIHQCSYRIKLLILAARRLYETRNLN